MNWGAPARNKPKAPRPPPSMSGEDPSAPSKSAAPAACPRCDITKSQFTKTMNNYQKAYRKKVAGLKDELTGSRKTVTDLKKEVTQLKSWSRVHYPSLCLGFLGAAATSMLFSLLRGRKKKAPKVARKIAAAETGACCGHVAEKEEEVEVEEVEEDVLQTEHSGMIILDTVKGEGEHSGMDIIDKLKGERQSSEDDEPPSEKLLKAAGKLT